jgi:hypothetical protein
MAVDLPYVGDWAGPSYASGRPPRTGATLCTARSAQPINAYIGLARIGIKRCIRAHICSKTIEGSYRMRFVSIAKNSEAAKGPVAQPPH